MDILSDVLRALRLKGTIYFQADFCAPWGMDIKGGAIANFHLVVAGTCWLRWEGSPAPLPISEGELILFPHGHRHALVHVADGAAPPAEQLLAADRTQDGTRKIYGGEGQATNLICGHFEYDREGRHPLFASLPPLIHLKSRDTSEAGWLETASRLAVMESGSQLKGSGAVVDRLAEVMLIQTLRAYAERLSEPEGFLAALADHALSSALALIHNHPEQQWSVNDLARRTGVSRSVFAERFKTMLGTSPMQYLTLWRMQKARELLQSEDHAVAEVAEAVGYQSEWAFARAFKRVFGMGPGAMRREGQGGGRRVG